MMEVLRESSVPPYSSFSTSRRDIVFGPFIDVSSPPSLSEALSDRDFARRRFFCLDRLPIRASAVPSFVMRRRTLYHARGSVKCWLEG